MACRTRIVGRPVSGGVRYVGYCKHHTGRMVRVRHFQPVPETVSGMSFAKGINLFGASRTARKVEKAAADAGATSSTPADRGAAREMQADAARTAQKQAKAAKRFILTPEQTKWVASDRNIARAAGKAAIEHRFVPKRGPWLFQLSPSQMMAVRRLLAFAPREVRVQWFERMLRG